MDIAIFKMLAEAGANAVLLGAVLLVVLPAMQRRHAQTIERIHKEDHAELEAELRENTRCVRQLARAVLVSSLTGQGKSLPEAEAEALRIVSNGGPS